ncbi:MAG TPA: hypothetical protein VM734_36365, partial [Kofleriaceae bacterium]|nr:hypothetical protein [Kofleriaceae bacterium]
MDGRRAGVRAAFTGAPVALTVALIASAVIATAAHSTLFWVTRPCSLDDWSCRRVLTIAAFALQGAWCATQVLALVGFVELARRVPARQALALRVGVGVIGLHVALFFVVLVLDACFEFPRRGSHPVAWEALQVWQPRMASAAAMATSVALLVAGWGHEVSRRLAGALVIATALAFPLPVTRDALDLVVLRADGVWRQLAILAGVKAAWIVLTLACAAAIGRGARLSAPARWADATAGLRRVGTALIRQVAITIIGAATLMFALAVRSGELLGLALWGLPLALALAAIGGVRGLVEAGGVAVRGAPRVRLYVAAGLVAWVASMRAIQGAMLFGLVGFDLPEASVDEMVEAWSVLRVLRLGDPSYVVPAVGLAAMLCLLSASVALRRLTGPASRG